MEIKYKWTISSTPCKPEDGALKNIVSEVHWRLKASNEVHGAEAYGAVKISETNDNEFTPYESLTKDQVVSWVVNALSVEGEPKSQLELIKENLIKDLELQANPGEINLPLPFEN